MERTCSRCRPDGSWQASEPEPREIVELLGRRWRRCPECLHVTELDARPSSGPWAVDVDPITPVCVPALSVPSLEACFVPLDSSEEIPTDLAVAPPVAGPPTDRTPVQRGGLWARDPILLGDVDVVLDEEEPTLRDAPPMDMDRELGTRTEMQIAPTQRSHLGTFLGVGIVAATLLAAFGMQWPEPEDTGIVRAHVASPGAPVAPALAPVTGAVHRTAPPPPRAHPKAPTVTVAALTFDTNVPVRPARAPSASVTLANTAPTRTRAATSSTRPDTTSDGDATGGASMTIPCEVATHLGDHAFERGDYELARSEFERALALNPEYLPARIGLADATWALGDTGTARAIYQRILEDRRGADLPERVHARGHLHEEFENRL